MGPRPLTHAMCRWFLTACEDVKETDNGSRWLTILDSWLPRNDADRGVDALVEGLSLDSESDDQRRSRCHLLVARD
jgi:hypothetical protein